MNLLISKKAAECFGTSRRIEVVDVQAASAEWCKMRDDSGLGCSVIGNGGNVLDNNNKQIATVSYNGRIWSFWH